MSFTSLTTQKYIGVRDAPVQVLDSWTPEYNDLHENEIDALETKPAISANEAKEDTLEADRMTTAWEM